MTGETYDITSDIVSVQLRVNMHIGKKIGMPIPVQPL